MGLSFDAQLGPYQGIAIGASTTYSTALKPGLYSFYADGASAQVDMFATGTGDPTNANPGDHYIKNGNMIYKRVGTGDPTFVRCRRAHDETGTGVLRINKHSDVV